VALIERVRARERGEKSADFFLAPLVARPPWKYALFHIRIRREGIANPLRSVIIQLTGSV
jgi:hypothetical protein